MAVITIIPVSAVGTSGISADVLAAYIEGAAGDLPLSVMSGVGAVLVNRCKSDLYPDSIVENGAALGVFPSASPSDMAKYTATLALSGFDPTNGAVYFYPVDSDKRQHHKAFETYVSSGICFAAG